MKPVNDHELKLMIQTRPTEVFAYIKDLQKRLHWAESENESHQRTIKDYEEKFNKYNEMMARYDNIVTRYERIVEKFLEERKNFPDHCDG
jgi:hypothetical protein